MKRHALFVGVNNYSDKDIHPLQFAVNDATDLAGFFRHCANFDRAEVLTDPRNCDAVLERVRDMTGGLGPDDEFVFFFAGHGVTTPDGHRLVCAGDDLVAVKHSWAGVPLERLKLETARSFNRLFLLDACRTDVLATHRGGACVMGKGTRDLILEGGGSFDARGGALTILCSCDDGECAGESAKLRHGLFSKAILELLDEKHNNGGKLFLDDDFAYRQLPERMRRLAVNSGMEFSQNPQKRGPAILLLDGIASTDENVDARRRIEEHRRLAAIREKEEQLAREEQRLREEKQRQEARLQEERRRIEEERRGRDVQSAVKTSLSERKRDNTEDRKPSSVTTASDRPKKCGLMYAVSLRGRMEWCMELYRHFGLDWQLVLKPFVVNFFEWFVRNCMGYVIAAFLIGLVGVVFWLLLYWRYLLENE